MRAAGEARGPDRLEPLVLAEGARVCGVEEATLECEGCGEQLCVECWAAGNETFCEECLLEEPEPRPVEDVPMGEGYL